MNGLAVREGDDRQERRDDDADRDGVAERAAPADDERG